MLQPGVMKQLQEETRYLLDVKEDIAKALRHYAHPDVAAGAGHADRVAKDLLSARGEFLSQCGRSLLKVASALAEVERKALSLRKPMKPVQRLECLAKECKGRFSKLEKQFRDILVQKRLFTANSLPERRHPLPGDEVAPSQARASAEVALSQATAMAKCLQVCQFNVVASRVRVKTSPISLR